MNRNLRGRVEVVFPVLDPDLKERVYAEVLELCLRDRIKNRFLLADGTYVRLQPEPGEPALAVQEALMRIAMGKKLDVPVPSDNGRFAATPTPLSLPQS